MSAAPSGSQSAGASATAPPGSPAQVPRLVTTLLVGPARHLLNSIRLVVFIVSMTVADWWESRTKPGSRSHHHRRRRNSPDRRSGGSPKPQAEAPASRDGLAGPEDAAEAPSTPGRLLPWYWIAGRRRRAKREVRHALGWAFGWVPAAVLAAALLAGVYLARSMGSMYGWQVRDGVHRVYESVSHMGSGAFR